MAWTERVRVVNGAVVEPTRSKASAELPQLTDLTIEGWFGYLASEQQHPTKEELAVAWDENTGAPKVVRTDHQRDVIDDEAYFYIEDLKPRP
jgi:hypothetical protein